MYLCLKTDVTHIDEIVLCHVLIVTQRYSVVLPNLYTLNVPYQSIFQREQKFYRLNQRDEQSRRCLHEKKEGCV